MTIAPLPPVADAEHLTEALRACGVLDGGSVREVMVESARTTILSRIVRLRLTYDDAGGAPASLILKTAHPDRIGPRWNSGRQEVAFYTEVAARMAGRSVTRCLGADWSPETHAWHLLLEDLTDTHRIATEWPLPPVAADCATMVETLARIHAEWWGDPRLGVTIGPRRDAAARDAYLRSLAAAFAGFAGRLGERLTADRRELYERLLDAAPRLLARQDEGGILTIVHGDAHAWNFFLPRDDRGDTRLFDWDAWRTGPGTNDLAYLIAVHWYPGHRRRLEPLLLDRYHAIIERAGVRGYDRRMLDEDYRRAVLWKVMTPVWQSAYDIPAVIWWNNYERIMLAVDDLDCRALLE